MSASAVAIVTGATGGIGRAIANSLHARGYRLVLQGFGTADDGSALATGLGDAVYLEADLSTLEGCQSVAAAAREHYGRIDVLVNNAGIGIPHPHRDIAGMTPEFFNRMLAVNLVGPWYLTQACADELRASGDGSIINMSSVAASTVSGSSIPYAVSKAGLEHLTKLTAVALGPEIRVNAIAPGLVDTPRTADWDEIRTHVSTTAPGRRSGQPEDIAQACLALLDNPHITGIILPVDGGLRLV